MSPLSPPAGVLSYAEAAATVRSHAEVALQAARSADRLTEPVRLIGYTGHDGSGHEGSGHDGFGHDALGRVLAASVHADRDQPPFARSTRDGFAVRAAEAAESLQVIGLLRAGESWDKFETGKLGTGEAVEIMTGAPVPPEADCVVMIEHVLRDGDSFRLVPGRTIKAGDNIVPAGAEARAGAVILRAGMRITPAQIAAAASCGAAKLSVWMCPRVAILATGDELVAIDQAPLPSQIRNSNTHSLAAQVIDAGGEPLLLPPARDDLEVLKQSVTEALRSADLLLLSGGVSMGKFDFVEQVLAELGAEFFFTGAQIQPGKPVVFGRVRGKYFFGLPGNPVSTMVTFLLFVAPFLRALGGERAEPRFVQARLTEAVGRKSGLTRFLPARMHFAVASPAVEPIHWQGSGDLAATAQSDCFIVVAAEPPIQLEAGDLVTVLLAE